MTTASIAWQPASEDAKRQARRGLAVYFAIVVPLAAVFQAIMIGTGDFVPWFLGPDVVPGRGLRGGATGAARGVRRRVVPPRGTPGVEGHRAGADLPDRSWAGLGIGEIDTENLEVSYGVYAVR